MNVTTNAALLVRQTLTGEVWPPLGDRHVYRTGDAVTVTAEGQGLALPDHPAVVVKNCAPVLLARMPGGTRPDGRLEVHVAARIPAEAVGAGAGMVSEYANTDLMGAYAGLGADLSLGLEGLRIGDIVAVADADHRFGRGYRPGYLTIGVISTGQCMLFGHGPAWVDADGHPYLPAGDGGLVLGVRLGNRVSALAGDHVAPGACLVHPDPASRHALVSYACTGNQAHVRTGRAAGARGVVIGKRGEDGRVITGFRQEDLARMRPGDEVTVRASGQGWQHPGVPPEVVVINAAPGLLAALPVSWPGHGPMTAGVRVILPSKPAGNGIGRSAAWDVDLQLGTGAAGNALGPGHLPGAAALLLGDLAAVGDLDARHNMGYRRGWLTVGLVVHGASPLPGHGPGLAPILTGPVSALSAVADAAGHSGLTESVVGLQ